jgi:hypothetical protein
VPKSPFIVLGRVLPSAGTISQETAVFSVSIVVHIPKDACRFSAVGNVFEYRRS